MPAQPPRAPHPLYDSNHSDFRLLYCTLRERSWLIGLCLLVAGGITAAYLHRAPKIYAAKAVLQVEQEEQKIINIQKVQTEDPQSQEFLKTVEQTLQSRALLERVLLTNNLAANPAFVKPVDGQLPGRQELVTRLARLVDVKLRKGTRLIDVRVEHTNPEITEQVARTLVEEYLRMNHEFNSSASENANSFLLGEARALEKKLEASEQALHQYKEEMNSVSLEDRQNIVVQELKDLSAKVTEAKSQRIIQEASFKNVQKLGDDVDGLLAVTLVANDPTVIDARREIAKLDSDIANLRQRYREKHPKFIQAMSELANRQQVLRTAVLNVREAIRANFESAKLAEEALEQELRAQEATALELNKLSIRYNVLARDVESDKALYQSVLNRIKETSVTKDIKPNKVRVIQQAVVPEKPVKPDRPTVLAIGLLAGLGLGIVLVLVLNMMDLTLKSVDQTEEFLETPVLSTIPRFSNTKGDQRKLITDADALNAEAESFRTLRTALAMLGRKEDRRTFLFTSAIPSEGKTFCSLNFAISLAQQGLRTLIIDCDLRRPMVEKTLLGNNQRGLGVTDFLTGEAGLNEVLHESSVDNLSYIPAGTDAPNPAELLAQVGIDGLIDEALLRFDRVIVDSPPLHAVSDTLLVLNRIQTLCLVIRARKTPRNSVRRAVQILREAEAPLAGVILNMLPRRRSSGYGYYYYDSYYDYSYRGNDYANDKKKGRAAKKKVAA